jgi:hypothetical protein
MPPFSNDHRDGAPLVIACTTTSSFGKDGTASLKALNLI